jgi:hypothetical protein
MMIRKTYCCALLMACIPLAWGGEKPPLKKAVKASSSSVTKPASKKTAQRAAETHAGPATRVTSKAVSSKPTSATLKVPFTRSLTGVSRPVPGTLVRASLANTPSPPAPALRGPTQTLTCRDGTEDRHARIGVVLVGGKTDSFAYYSKWKPRTCSIYLQRNRDGYAAWVDNGNTTSIKLARGHLVIEHDKDEYRFVFQDVDRERYCGMDGVINGTLTIRKGSERCELAGVMDEGVLLGQAHIQHEQASQTAVAAASTQRAQAPRTTVASASTLRTRVKQWSILRTESTWPSSGGPVSD